MMETKDYKTLCNKVESFLWSYLYARCYKKPTGFHSIEEMESDLISTKEYHDHFIGQDNPFDIYKKAARVMNKRSMLRVDNSYYVSRRLYKEIKRRFGGIKFREEVE